MGYAVFFLVILLSNIIQGITGFAGTILAMPPSLMLVGYDTAKPVLNVLGLLSGIYVFAGHRKHVCWGELKKIVAVMAAGIVGGIFLKGFFAGRERALYALLGLFVVCLSLQGLHKLWRDWLGTQEDAAAGAEAAAEAKAAAGAKAAEAKAAAEGKAAGPDKAGLYLLLGLLILLISLHNGRQVCLLLHQPGKPFGILGHSRVTQHQHQFLIMD